MNQNLDTILEELNIDKDVYEKLEEKFKEKISEVANNAELRAQHKLEETLEVVYEKAELYAEGQVERALREAHENHSNEIDLITEKAEEYATLVREETIDQVQGYIDHVVENFITENHTKFEQLRDYERMRVAFQMIKESFELNGFNVVVDHDQNLVDELAEAKKAYNDTFDELMEAKEELEEANRQLIFETKTKDLTATQKNKVSRLVKSTKADSDMYLFESSLDSIIENVFDSYSKPEPEPKKEVLTEQTNDKMRNYLSNL